MCVRRVGRGGGAAEKKILFATSSSSLLTRKHYFPVFFSDLIEKIRFDSDSGDDDSFAFVDLQLRAFYDSCMDVDSIRIKGSVPGGCKNS